MQAKRIAAEAMLAEKVYIAEGEVSTTSQRERMTGNVTLLPGVPRVVIGVIEGWKKFDKELMELADWVGQNGVMPASGKWPRSLVT